MPQGGPRVPPVVERAPADRGNSDANRPPSRNDPGRGDSQSGYRDPKSSVGMNVGAANAQLNANQNSNANWDDSAPQQAGGSGGLVPHPAGYYVPPSIAASIRRGEEPVRPFDDPTSAPASSEQTRVYRGRDAPPPSTTITDMPLQKASTMPFVLGAIAFALVGFGIVATVLHFLVR
jgi:hypothetical protein